MIGAVFILIIAIILLLLTFKFEIKENYDSIENNIISGWDLNSPVNIGDCYRHNEKDCLRFSNCGLCEGKCIPGDYNGPYYKLGCKDWIYYDYYLNKVRKGVPFDKQFPNYYYRYGALNNFVGI